MIRMIFSDRKQYDGSKLLEILKDEKQLNRLRRLARKQFKEDTSHDSTYSLRMLIVPLRWDGVRLKITVTRQEQGMAIAHTLSQWVYKRNNAMFELYESVTVAPAHNGKPTSFDFNPQLSETRGHAIKALYAILGDPIMELRMAALSKSKNAVVGI